MIPKNIKINHILKAIEETERNGIPKGRRSKKFNLEHNHKHYPPKYIISLANKFANGEELSSEDFGGGKETNDFLEKLRFKITDKSLPDENAVSEVRYRKIKRSKSVHNQGCKDCKETIKKILEKAYGAAESNYKFEVGTHPEDHKDSEYYWRIKEIYEALQNYRGFKEFVKVISLPRCDFFVPNPGFILEFDEYQHFTKPREITLLNYPVKLRLGFDKNKWIYLCRKLNRRDNDPPYRDEQRAWYDTLRDFSVDFIKYPVIRVFAQEHVWCELNENDERDVIWFKDFIETKLESISELKGKTSANNGLEIGLAFPELGEHDISHFLRLLREQKNKLDLIIFPEGFEIILPENKIKPKNVKDEEKIKSLTNKYHEICQELNISIIVGISIDYRDTSISGGDNDQYCLFITPAGEKFIYHKHSTSRYNAFYDDEWSIEDNFPIFKIEDKKIGISICHDSYISLIPRILKEKGADIWVNISYQNVRPWIWEPIHQTRALENKIIALCTLHRNSNKKKNVQKEPYALSEEGKIKLKDLSINEYILEIPFEERTGRIFYFNSSDYETYPLEKIEPSELAKKAEPIEIKLNNEGRLDISGTNGKFLIREISLKEFIFSPEIIWNLFFENLNVVPFLNIWVRDNKEWEEYISLTKKIIKGRVIEFSTLFIFREREKKDILMAAYRSSKYKDTRVFYPDHFPVEIDKRFLKGLESTINISLNDKREKKSEIYFKRVRIIIEFLQKYPEN